jgi:hypothetical protein
MAFALRKFPLFIRTLVTTTQQKEQSAFGCGVPAVNIFNSRE